MIATRVAVIDLGTNSVRFDVHEVSKRKVIQTLHRERLMVRLGEGVFVHGAMSEAAMQRTMEAFDSFRYTVSELGVEKVIAVGTSALRQAANREKLVRAIQRRTGIEIRVISGEEEARFIARGILTREKGLPSRFALVDIGGGSTEVTICQKKSVLWSTSLQLGTARLEQLFSLGDAHATTASRRQRARELGEYVDKQLGAHQKVLDRYHVTALPLVIGSSGTIKALVRLEGAGDGSHRTLSAPFLNKMIERMLKMSREHLLGMAGMDPARVDMILGGAVLLQHVMRWLGAKKLRLTEFALREGLIDEEIKLIHDRRDSHLGLHLNDLAARLERRILGKQYALQVSRVSEELFDRLEKLHRLRPEWKYLLIAAALLHNTGTTISPVDHAGHSYYIAMHIDFPWLNPSERIKIAHLCRYHNQSKIGKKDLRFLKKDSDKRAFVRALALLALSDALVWHNRSQVEVLSARVTRSSIFLKVSANGSSELVKLRVEAKKKLFERVFRRALVVE